jgi:hypothetical protein
MARRRLQETPVPQRHLQKCAAVDLPVGHDMQDSVKKNFFFYENILLLLFGKSWHSSAHPASIAEGRCASSRNARRDAMDAPARATSAAGADGKVVWS